MPAPAGSGHLDVPGGRLYYEISGTGPPLVFLHAGIADRRMWDREFVGNAKRATTVRYDRRGFGWSPAATASYSDVEDLAALLAQVGRGPALLVGCSNGGRLAIDFALTHPGSVRALLLVSGGITGFDLPLDPEGKPDFDRDNERSMKIVEAWSAGRKEEAMEMMREYWCSALTGPNLGLARLMIHDNAEEIFTDRSAHFSRAPEPPAVERVGSLKVPTVAMWGDRDEPTTGRIVRWVAQHLPGARYVQVPGADHLINLSRPEAFDHALASLLG